MNSGFFFQPVFSPISDQIIHWLKCAFTFGWCWYETFVTHELNELIEVINHL